MIKGIIFDVDGVILDSMGIWEGLGAKYLLTQGKIAKPDLDSILFDLSLEEGAEYMRKEYSLDKSNEEIVKGIDKIVEDFYFNEVTLKSGMKNLIKSFYDKGIPLIIASSSPKEHLKRALERNGVLEYFKGIYTPDDSGEGKRSPKLYNMTAEIIGTSPSETAVFEDAVYGLNTAKNAGYLTVGVNDIPGGQNQDDVKALSDYYIDDTASADADKIIEFFGR